MTDETIFLYDGCFTLRVTKTDCPEGILVYVHKKRYLDYLDDVVAMNAKDGGDRMVKIIGVGR